MDFGEKHFDSQVRWAISVLNLFWLQLKEMTILAQCVVITVKLWYMV